MALVLALGVPGSASAEEIFGSTEDGQGTRVAGVCVEAFSADAGREAAPVAQTVSDNVFYGGHWNLTVPPGNYKIRFAACGGPADPQFHPEWFNHHSGWGSAVITSVGAGQTRDLGRYALPAAHPMGTITGTLTAPDGSQAGGWCAVALDPAGSGFDGSVRTYDVTDANGRYAIQYLRTGPWKLFFTTRCGGFTGTRFDEEYFNDKTSLAAADAVTVEDGQTTAGINATLNWLGGAPPGLIGGVVTVGSAPRAGVCVGALDPATGAVVRGTVSNDDGTYALPYLTRGSYKVVFGTSECPAARGPSVPRTFFSGQPDFASAQEVAVFYSPVMGVDMAYPALAAETVSKTVGPGETVSTDTGAGATVGDPLIVDLKTPQTGR